MKRFILIVIILTCSLACISQNISVNELLILCNKSKWDEVNEYMLMKDWEYHKSTKGDDYNYNTITWSYNKDYNDKAQGWFYLYTYEGFPNKIVYTFFNKQAYNVIKNGIKTSGMTLFDSSIDDNKITSQYSNSNFILTLITAKRESDETYYNENSITAYSVTIVKKAGIYDNENGHKKNYSATGELESEYTLVSGKITGYAKSYYSNGQVKSLTNFANGVKQGLSKEYDEDGKLSGEYNYSNNLVNGMYKIYENGKIKIIGYAINGEGNGQFKVFDEDGNLVKEYYMKSDVLEGPCNSYFYYEGSMRLKELGFYHNNKKNGLWQSLQIKDNKDEILESINYKDGIKNGPFKEIKSDSIIFGTYKDDKLDGLYSIYTNIKSLVFGSIHGDTTNCPLIVRGNYLDDQKSGKWYFYSLSNDLIKEGVYQSDKENGEWKYYFESSFNKSGQPQPYSGKLFLIENYENGAKYGKETRYAFLKQKTVPCDSNNNYKQPNDSCIEMIYEKTNITAYYKNNELNGPFVQIDTSGVLIYKGNFLSGKKDGYWIESYPNRINKDKMFYTFIRGEYKDGKENGIWEEYTKEDFIRAKYNFTEGKLNGKTTYYLRNKNPKENKYFTNGIFNKVEIFDSLGLKIIRSYEVQNETDVSFKCIRTLTNDTFKTIQSFIIKKFDKSSIDHNFFELTFLLSIDKQTDENGELKGFADGDYKVFDSKNNLLVDGFYLKNKKSGIWRCYYSDINIYTEQAFSQDNSGPEKYLLMNNSQPFSGKFVQYDSDGKKKLEFKIKDGLRDGKSKYYDEFEKEIKIEKYKKGIIEI